MREIFKSGSVGGAPGNRCFYLETGRLTAPVNCVVRGRKDNIMRIFGFLKKHFDESEKTDQKNGLSVREAEAISREFGKFLAEELPVIKDAELLPHTKEKIMEALNISIQQFRKQTDFDTSKMLNALETCRQVLSTFAKIDSCDQEAVSYFNQFSNVKLVPEERKGECIDLITKYMKQGMVGQ